MTSLFQLQKSFFILSFISLVLGAKLTSNGANYQTDTNKGSVVTFYDNQTKSNNANYFQYSFIELREIMKNGTPCCDSTMPGCTYQSGCNHHAIYGFDLGYWTEKETNTSTSFNATRQAEISFNCIPPTSSSIKLICVDVRYNYEILNETKIVSSGNYSFTAKQDSLLVTIAAYQWTMISNTSGGLNIKIMLNIPHAPSTGYYKLPQNELFSGSIETNTFQGIAWQNDQNDIAAIDFSPFAILDNVTTVKVDVSGVYNHSSNQYAKYVQIYLPRQFVSMEYKMSLYLASVSGKNQTLGTITEDKKKSFLATNKMYIIYAAIALVVFIILIIGIAVCIRKTC